jgi:hypothetical protein
MLANRAPHVSLLDANNALSRTHMSEQCFELLHCNCAGIPSLRLHVNDHCQVRPHATEEQACLAKGML